MSAAAVDGWRSYGGSAMAFYEAPATLYAYGQQKPITLKAPESGIEKDIASLNDYKYPWAWYWNEKEHVTLDVFWNIDDRPGMAKYLVIISMIEDSEFILAQTMLDLSDILVKATALFGEFEQLERERAAIDL